MRNNLEESKQAGEFFVSPTHKVYGELTAAAGNSSLFLRDEELSFNQLPCYPYINGVLHDLTKVTLIDCVAKTGESVIRDDGRYSNVTIFPHCIIAGNRHFLSSGKTISEIQFTVDDASTLFYDKGAFGRLYDARPFIETIAHANDLGRAVPPEQKIITGTEPQILYFTGKCEIFSVDTVLGKISASHNPTYEVVGSNRACLNNTIFVTVAFAEMVTFNDCLDRISTLLQFFEILVGRPQNLLELNLNTDGTKDVSSLLRVYCSTPPKREPLNEGKRPDSSDVLMEAAQEPDIFSDVLARWLARHMEWRDARGRFSESFSHQNTYDIDRLISSANMFDILPSAAVPNDVQLSDALKSAKDQCVKIFKELPQSPERDSVLNSLGRLGKSALKHKIRHRGQLITKMTGGRLIDLDTVIDQAVNCRNHYVHGSSVDKPPKFDYSENFGMLVFFTATLEFIFAASDLGDAGLEIEKWKNVRSRFHPFRQYLDNYHENIEKLKELLAPTVSS